MIEKHIRIDPNRVIGPIKPMHGVGGGPVSGNFSFDASDLFRAAGIPFGRTHDIEYPFGLGEFVDVHCIFPCFEADASDPKSYNFALTDEYLRCMADAGTEPFYRLGASIEHQPVKRHIRPPKDFEKFADICSHIVAHMNEGWADGHHFGIRYWEIWNEPDIPQCWTGTDEEIFELYRAIWTKLKREHPSVKVGGLALTSPWSRMFEPFLRYARDNGCPPDFVSWHGYCHTPAKAVEAAEKARALMDEYGFAEAESIFNEWNYVVDWQNIQPSLDLHRTAFAAAFMASVLSAVQNTRTDKLMFYDAQILMTGWNNLFAPTPMAEHAARRSVKPLKGYWALRGWNELYRAGTQIGCAADTDLWCTAAKDAGGKTLLYAAYFNDDAGLNACPPPKARIVIDMPGVTGLKIRTVDDESDFEETERAGNSFKMKGNSFSLIRVVTR